MTLQTEMGNTITVTKVFFMTLSLFTIFILCVDTQSLRKLNTEYTCGCSVNRRDRVVYTWNYEQGRLLRRRYCSLLIGGSYGDLQLGSLEMSGFLDLYILWNILYFYILVVVA